MMIPQLLRPKKAKKNPKIEFITSASVDEVYGDNIAGVKGIKVKGIEVKGIDAKEHRNKKV